MLSEDKQKSLLLWGILVIEIVILALIGLFLYKVAKNNNLTLFSVARAETPKTEQDAGKGQFCATQSITEDTLLPTSPPYLVKGQVLVSLTTEMSSILDKLAMCESGNNPDAINWNDNGSPSFGLLQFKQITWNENCEGDIMNTIAQKNCAIKLLQKGESWRWKNCFEKIK